MTSSRVIGFALFQVGWIACAVGGARASVSLALAVALPVIGYNVVVSWRPWRTALLACCAAVVGPLVDGLLVRAGLLELREPLLLGAWMPAWWIALWALFASTVPVSFDWLFGRHALAAGCGLVFGPLSYWAGGRIGALSLPEEPWLSLAAIALEWAVLCPLLAWIACRAMRAPDLVPGPVSAHGRPR
jgi:hypothetical protein